MPGAVEKAPHCSDWAGRGASGRVQLALKGSDFEALTVMTRQLWVR